jgi:hypothetical protein
MRATRDPGAPPLVITVDAALIAGYRANGNLDQLNALARQMIASGAPIVTSWDAWAAHDSHESGDPTESLVRPEVWPTPDVLRLINYCRSSAGLPERAPPS